jgi:diguanylate cyclase (GGDEF)-like protein
MKKILIIQNDQILGELISAKISLELDYEVEIAYTAKEAKLFLHMYKYFLVLTDLDFEDAPKADIVEYLIKKEYKTLVLSANTDKELIATVETKNIIDYIPYHEINDIEEYVIASIKQLQNNQHHTIIVADPSMARRSKLKIMLENLFFKVITVAHGEEVLNLTDVMPDISMVITNYKMPVIDGLTLTKELRKTYTKNSLKIIAIASQDDDDINILFLTNGANDFLNYDFSRKEFSTRVSNSIDALETVNKLTSQSTRDPLTGLYNAKYFLSHKDSLELEIQESAEISIFCMLDLDNSDSNDNMQKEEILIILSDILKTNVFYKDLIIRYNTNEFYIILKHTNLNNALNRLNKILFEIQGCLIKFSVSIGLAKFQDTLDDTISQEI